MARTVPGGSPARAGGALVFSLLVVVFVAGLSMALLELTGSTGRRQASATNLKLAFYAAEAGLAEAYAGLAIGKTGNVGTELAPAVFGDALFWVEATDNGDETVTLDCTAMHGNGRALLSLVARRGETSVASLGVFAQSDLDIAAGSVIDGYDSAEGPYVPPPTVDPTLVDLVDAGLDLLNEETSLEVESPFSGSGRLGSNGPIQVDGTSSLPTLVDGDVTPGPQHAVQTTGEVTITGSTEAAAASTPLPPVEVPQLPIGPGADHASLAPLVLPSGDLGLEFLRVRGGATATVVGPARLVVGELGVDPGGALGFDTTGGAVEVYVLDDLHLAGGSYVAMSDADPSQVVVQVAGPTPRPVTLGSGGAFHGVLYAPEAEVVVLEGFEVYGSLIGGALTFSGPSKLHFDQHLDRVAAEAALPRLVSWRIVELSNPVGMRPGESPFAFLGLDRNLLDRPADAHADQLLSITYKDSTGATRTYDGSERAFDWSQVKEVLSLTRDGRVVRTSFDPGGAVNAQQPQVDPADQALIDLVNDPAKTSADLYNDLLAASPLSDVVLVAAVERSPAMDVADLYWLLNHEGPVKMPGYPGGTGAGPIPDGVLGALVQSSFPSKELSWVLEQNSPLSAGILDATLGRVPALKPGDLNRVLAAQ